MTVHSGQEQILWEGESHNVKARATGGRFTLHYRLTTHYLYYESGGITGTKRQQIPLLEIRDVDVAQTLIQKTQRVGNVLVHITRPDGIPETATLDWVPDPIAVRDLINRAIHEMRVLVHGRQVHERKDVGVHRFDTTGGVGWAPGVPVPPLPGLVQPAAPLPAAQPPALPPGFEAPPANTPEQVMALLKQLGELRDAGVVTPEEFETKKKDLLDRL
jgi:Short C-terminal domain/Bacterial PH domain